MGVREEICFRLSKRLVKPPPVYHTTHASHAEWRGQEAMAVFRRHFSSGDIREKEVLDFGCGYAHLWLELSHVEPRRVVGIDQGQWIVDECNKLKEKFHHPERFTFLDGAPARIPVDDEAFDTVLALEVVPHVAELEPIVREWRRVIRPNGRVLISWTPYRSPYGSHMSALIPLPWAHVIFGEKALLRSAERMVDEPGYVPRLWDFDKQGNRLPNKFRGLRSFKEQGFINQMTLEPFLEMVKGARLTVDRFEAHSFGGSPAKKIVGGALAKLPLLGEFVTSLFIMELRR
jgi:2-polyprenyl-3-methyl-5-hydroxy-6-metoxy-1,4-benzoquinol methylase